LNFGGGTNRFLNRKAGEEKGSVPVQQFLGLEKAKWGQIFTFDIHLQVGRLGAMARPLRVEFEGALYHLTGRGNARQKVFADQADCTKFVQLLMESLERYDVVLHGYVLMGNHYHLIAETRRANLGQWMHWLTTAYTVYFNRRHRRAGHLFQGRYKSIVVEAEGYLLSLSRYVHLNPVRGQVIGRGDPVERRKRLRDWHWGSYPATAD
jgi:putative transposase